MAALHGYLELADWLMAQGANANIASFVSSQTLCFLSEFEDFYVVFVFNVLQ